jgi:hypothetical protein
MKQKVEAQNQESPHSRKHSPIVRQSIHNESLVFVVSPRPERNLVRVSDERVARASVVDDPLVDPDFFRKLFAQRIQEDVIVRKEGTLASRKYTGDVWFSCFRVVLMYGSIR